MSTSTEGGDCARRKSVLTSEGSVGRIGRSGLDNLVTSFLSKKEEKSNTARSRGALSGFYGAQLTSQNVRYAHWQERLCDGRT